MVEPALAPGYPRAMLEHISMGVADLPRSARFYDAVLAPLGYVCLHANPRGVTYGPPGATDEAFAILQLPPGTTPTAPGWHVAFKAPSREAVVAFHAAALAHGGTDDGAPGLRESYGPTYFAAFARDPDGFKVEAACLLPG